MTGRFVQSNGVRLHYLEAGSGPPLVMLHGLTANAHSFDGLVAAGLPRHVRLIALDLRGRGESDQPPDGYGLPEHAGDVLALLDALGLEQVVLGGHSFGGLLTYYLASHYPARVSRCVVIDAPAEVHPQILDQIKPSVDRLALTMPSWNHYLEFVRQLPYFKGWWDPNIESFYRADVRDNADGSVQPRSRPETIHAVVEGFKDLDYLSMVRRIRQPVLFIRAPGPCGPEGSPALVSARQAQLTVEHLANGQLLEVPGNHMTMLFGEGAPIAARAIADFVHE
jgi:pimeloyl-ACP methyl ester carboxylesterase